MSSLGERECIRTKAAKGPRARFSKLPGPVLFSILEGASKRFENSTVKLSAKETKWTSSEVGTRPIFLETLISKSDSGPVSYRVFRETCLRGS